MGGMTGEIKYGKVLYLKVFPAIDGRDGGFHRKTTIFSLSEASIGLNETPGAMTFPHWEHDIPSVGILSLLFNNLTITDSTLSLPVLIGNDVCELANHTAMDVRSQEIIRVTLLLRKCSSKCLAGFQPSCE